MDCVKVMTFTPRVFLGNPIKNAGKILDCIEIAKNSGTEVAVFPMNAITGDTLGDLADFANVFEAKQQALSLICIATQNWGGGVILGDNDNLMYISGGEIQKVYENSTAVIDGVQYICAANPAQALGLAQTKEQILALSYGNPVVYTSAGYGESTTDTVPDGVMMVAQKGEILAEHAGVYGEDFGKLVRFASCSVSVNPFTGAAKSYVPRSVEAENPTPFLPCPREQATFATDIFHIQVAALVRRMEHVGAKNAIVALSGGLDSALALLVAKKAVELLGLPPTALLAITMPCFGTTGRTLANAQGLMAATGATCRTINIADSVAQHFKDIGHEMSDHSVVFENAQARERTQIGLDLANKIGGIFVGTGDLSELVLGFTTFSGDHLSMYGVNGGLPKTIVRFVTRHLAGLPYFALEKSFLEDILETPISPELLPPADDVMSQKTESILGSYDLHDYGIYHLLHGVSTSVIYKNALQVFGQAYSTEDIEKAMKTLFFRFVTQQFKRSCLADGPAVLDISVSPRGGLVMPSDMDVGIWTI